MSLRAKRSNPGLRTLNCFVALLLAMTFMWARSRSIRAAEPVTLRYGQAFSAETTIYSLPIHIAMRYGQFAREGLALHQFFIPGGGAKMIDALNDGTVELTHIPMSFLIRRVLRGSDAVAIATEFNNPIYSLMAKPDIHEFADLRGKLVGLAEEGSPITISTRKLLALHGLGAGDVREHIVSGTPARLGCLTRGTCDAVPLGQPQDFTAARQGFRILGYTSDAVPSYVYTVTAVRRSWATAHKDVLVRYVRALAAAFQFVRDPAHRPEVVAAIVEDTGCSPADAERTLALYFEPERKALPEHGEIDMNAVAQTLQLMRAGGELKGSLPDIRRFVDLQYLRTAGLQSHR